MPFIRALAPGDVWYIDLHKERGCSQPIATAEIVSISEQTVLLKILEDDCYSPHTVRLLTKRVEFVEFVRSIPKLTSVKEKSQ